MPQIQRMPFRGSGTLGRGVNTLTGEFVGKALNVTSREEAVPGGEVAYDFQITETHESLMESLGLSVEASGRYGLFSAEGKFQMSQKSNFNAASTFVVASCRVRNAFVMADKIELVPGVETMLEDPNKFRTAYGTSFVRGLETGGEFYVVLQVTSTSAETQSSLGASFQAECQGLAASGDFKAAFDQAKQSKSNTTQVSVLMYQRAGTDDQLSYVSDASEVIARLKEFPKIARAKPCGYECEVADYNTLALPEANQEEIADRQITLTDCARLRLKYLTRRNDIDFARENPVFFEDLPSDSELGEYWDRYSRAVALVQIHAQNVAGRRIPPTLFDLSAADPALDLPVIIFRRVNMTSDIPVPRLINYSYERAKAELAKIGLESEDDGRWVEKESGEPLNTVLAQNPEEGTLVPTKTPIRLTYNYVVDLRPETPVVPADPGRPFPPLIFKPGA